MGFLTQAEADAATAAGVVFADGVARDSAALAITATATVFPNSIDDTASLQAALNLGKFVSLVPGKSYKITDTLFFPAGVSYFYFNGASFVVDFGTNYSKPLFSNRQDADVSTTFNVKDIRGTGNCLILNAQFQTNNPNAGLTGRVDNIDWNTMDGNRRSGTGVIKASQIDGLTINNVSVFNMDLAIGLGTAGLRNSTQINLRNWLIQQTRAGLRFDGVDKADLTAIDISRCNTGFVFATSNKRIQLTNCHVEGIAAVGYQTTSAGVPAGSGGYGYYYPDGEQNEVTLRSCSTIDMGATGGAALGSLYQGTCSTPANQFVLHIDCKFAPAMDASPNYRAIINRGQFRWQDVPDFPFTTSTSGAPYAAGVVSLSANGAQYQDNLIRGLSTRPVLSENLIGGSTPLSLVDGPTINGAASAPTITDVNEVDASNHSGFDIVFTSAGYQLARIVNLGIGWHTIWFQGRRKSGNPLLFVQQTDAPNSDLIRAQIVDTTGQDSLWRLCFYNPVANRSYKVGLTNQAVNDAVQVVNIGLNRGFTEYPILHRGAETVAALPTASAKWVGKQVRVAVSGSDDLIRTGYRTAAGGFAFQ